MPSGTLFFVIAFLSLANGGLLLFVNSGRATNRVFFFVSVWLALWFFCVFQAAKAGQQYIEGPAHDVLFWLRLSSAVAAFMPWLIWLMHEVLVSNNYRFSAAFQKSYPAIAFSALIAWLAFSEHFIPSHSTPKIPERGNGYFVYAAAIASSFILLVGSTARSVRRHSGAKRIEVQILVLNTVCACLSIAIATICSRIFDKPWLQILGQVVFATLHILTVWTICYHRVFDANQVVVSVARKAVFFTLVAAGAIVPVALLSDVGYSLRTAIVPALCGTCVALFAEGYVITWLRLDPEIKLVERRREIIKIAREEPDTEKLRRRLISLVEDWFQTDHVDILGRQSEAYIGDSNSFTLEWNGLPCLCGSGWVTPESLQRKRPEPGWQPCSRLLGEANYGALIAVPRGASRPSLIMALGKKRSLRPYTYPDIRQLIDLAELMDNILAHATLSSHAAKLAQLEAATMLSRSLAHDLNNLTMPVATYLLHTEGRDAPGSAEAEVHAAASQAVKVMNEYIRESLFFSRQLSLDLRQIAPGEILTKIVATARERADHRNIALCAESQTDTSFRADPALVQRLALNLIYNALDASAPGTTVSVSLVAGAGETILLSVQDQGAGVPPEIRRRIFDPYFTTKNTGGALRGLGLGLAICRKIAELHGGAINIQESTGRGARFTAVFPVAGPRSVRISATVPAATAAPIQPGALSAMPNPA